MSRYRVKELEGALLDVAVAKASADHFTEEELMLHAKHGFHPSADWSDGGPIIERELIFFSELPMHEGGPEVMVARCGRSEGRGRGHLIAAMRSYVSSKLGEEVDLP